MTIKEEKVSTEKETMTLDEDDYEESDDEGENDEESEDDDDQNPEEEDEDELPLHSLLRRNSSRKQVQVEPSVKPTKPKRTASSPNLFTTIKKEKATELVNPLSRSLSSSSLKKRQRQRRSTAKKAIQKSKDMLGEASSEGDDDSSESEFEPEPVELTKSWGKQAESSDDEDEDDLVEEEELSEEEVEEDNKAKKSQSRRRKGDKKAKTTPKKPRRKQLPNIYNPEHDEGDISSFKYILQEAEQVRLAVLFCKRISITPNQ